MKTFTKHILLLALMLFGVAGAAWAQTHQKYTGPVAFSDLQVDDTLAPGFELTGISASDNLQFDGGRYSFNGTPSANPTGAAIGTANSLSYPDGNIVLVFGQATFTLAPMVDMTTAGNAWVVTDASHTIAGSDIHISGITISLTPDPTVPALDETTGHWNFLMPGSNKVVKVTYKAEPALAWTFGGRAIPNDTTLTAYRGFELPVIGSIGAIMDHDFLTALLGGTVSLRYGSTNPAVISFTNPNDMWSFSVNGAGECDVYMVFDGDNDYQFDSVAFHAVIAEPATLTLDVNNSEWGSVTIPIGLVATDPTPAPTPTAVANPVITGVLMPDGSMQVTMSCTTQNADIYYTTDNVTSPTCDCPAAPEYTHPITFTGPVTIKAAAYTGNDWSAVVTKTISLGYPEGIMANTDGTFSVLPGTEVNVTATPDSAHYLARIDGQDTVGNHACGYSFVMPSNDKDLLAVFEAKPTLTLTQTEGGTLEAIVPQGGPVLLTTVTATGESSYSQSPDGIVTVTLNNTSRYSSTYGWLENGSVTVEAAQGYTITRCLFKQNDKDPLVDDLAPFTATMENLAVSAETSTGQVNGGLMDGITSIEVYTTSTPNVIASSTPNTYIIDYGTPVTVVATPDSVHYLVSFSDDDPATERNSNIAVEKTYDSVIADIPNLTANFQAKPVLTLTANDGGTLTLDGMTNRDSVLYNIEINYQPQNITAYPYQKVMNFNGEVMDPMGGNANVSVAKTGPKQLTVTVNRGFSGSMNLSALEFDGQNYGSIMIPVSGTPAGSIQLVELPAGVVSANATLDTFVVDYGADVTVVATPDATHYLASLGDELVNSNDSIHRTFTMTAPVNLPADFRAKPVLTLAQNESQWGSVTIPTGLVATDPTPAPTPTTVANPVITCELMPDGSMQVTMSCTTPDADIYYTTDNVTSPLCDCPAAPEYHNAIPFTEPVTIKAAAYTGNDWSAVVTKTISLGYPEGIMANTDGTYTVNYGQTVTLIAEAAELHHVAGWQNESGTAMDTATYNDYAVIAELESLFPAKSALTFTMTKDTTVRALFGLNSYDVTARATVDSREVIGTDTAMGVIACVSYLDIQGNPQTVAPDSVITYTAQGGSTSKLVAQPYYGYLFKHWQVGDDVYLQDTLTLTAATEVVAVFVPDTFSFATATNNFRWGTVEADADGRYPYLSQMTLEAVPTIGNHFVEWSDGDTNHIHTISLTQDTELTATFARTYYTVVYNPNEEGRGTISCEHPNPFQSNYGYTTHMKATAEYGYHFVRWQNAAGTAVLGLQDSIDIVVTKDTAIVAVFEPNSYLVTAQSESATKGSVTGSGNYLYLSEATLTATAKNGYHFTQWNDGDTLNPRTVEVLANATYTAQFAKNLYTVTVVSADTAMGSASGTATVEYESSVQLTATANEHYHFAQWQDGNKQNPRNYTVTGDATMTAKFAPDQYIVKGVADQGRGSVTGSGSYDYLTNVMLTAVPTCGFVFDHWSDNSTDGTITVTATEDMILTAYFRAVAVDTVEVHDTIEYHDTTVVALDTMYINVPDTTLVPVTLYDTTTVDVTMYDTTVVDITMYDTTSVPIQVFDTVVVPVTIVDTTLAPVVVYDTTTIDVTLYDTTNVAVTVYDTTSVPVTIYDTTNVAVTVYDTTTVPVTVYDTTVTTVPVTVYDTTTVPVTVIDTTIVPVTEYDTTHVAVIVVDSTLVPIYDTIWLTEYIRDTVYIEVHDTVYIHDTIFVGIDEVDALDAKIYANNGQIVVEGAEGNTVVLYDVTGRILAKKQDEFAPLRFDIPASGTYLVKIGNHAARRIVMIR